MLSIQNIGLAIHNIKDELFSRTRVRILVGIIIDETLLTYLPVQFWIIGAPFT